MQDDNNLSEIEIQNQKIIDNKELNLYEALIPVIILMAMLAYNIFYAGGELLGEYSNQFI
ncbi:MAG TPA: sodium:proton antiporter, partial [Lutibacter sp.]|nr:sodium:proton antiporter [Lutibacter sp.]